MAGSVFPFSRGRFLFPLDRDYQVTILPEYAVTLASLTAW